jgi:hypothetical protein
MSRPVQIAVAITLVVLGATLFFVLGDRAGEPPAEEVPQHSTSSDQRPVAPRTNTAFDTRADDDEPDGAPRNNDQAQPLHARDADAGSGSTAAADAGDAGEAPAKTAQWRDETNERVLGEKKWMATVDAEEVSRINEVFRRSRALRADPRINNAGRRSSIQVVEKIVGVCFEDLGRRVPEATGRIAVAYTATADEGGGRITKPRISLRTHMLQEEKFEACVVDGLRGQRFDAAPGDPIEVEHPIFFDGAF